MWAETVWALTYAMLAILRQHVIWLAATSEMSSRLLHTVVFTPSIANSTWMDSWEKKQRSNLMKYQQARATWMKEEQENQESLSHIRAAVLTLLQENTSEKDQKSERDLYGRTSWWTMFIHWWEQRQNHLNHLLLPLVFFLSMATDEPGQMARTLSLRENNRYRPNSPSFSETMFCSVFFLILRLKSRWIHHKSVSNRKVLSSSNIIQPHAMCGLNLTSADSPRAGEDQRILDRYEDICSFSLSGLIRVCRLPVSMQSIFYLTIHGFSSWSNGGALTQSESADGYAASQISFTGDVGPDVTLWSQFF